MAKKEKVEATGTFTVVTPVKTGGKRYAIGDELKLDETITAEAAEAFLASGSIKAN